MQYTSVKGLRDIQSLLLVPNREHCPRQDVERIDGQPSQQRYLPEAPVRLGR